VRWQRGGTGRDVRGGGHSGGGDRDGRGSGQVGVVNWTVGVGAMAGMALVVWD